MQVKQAAGPNDLTLISSAVGKVLRHVTPYILVENTNVSDKPYACIIRVELYKRSGNDENTGVEANHWRL